MRRFAALVVLASLLTGCAQLPDSTAPGATTPPSTTAASTAPGAAQPEPAATDPQPSADAELEAFLAAIAEHTPTDPGALVAAVEAAGFPRSSIEHTREVDSLGAPVTFLEIAVLDGDSCIVGQVGDGEPMAIRASPLGGGRCLVGGIVTVD